MAGAEAERLAQDARVVGEVLHDFEGDHGVERARGEGEAQPVARDDAIDSSPARDGERHRGVLHAEGHVAASQRPQRVADAAAEVEEAQRARRPRAQPAEMRLEGSQREVVVRGVPEIRLARACVPLLGRGVLSHRLCYSGAAARYRQKTRRAGAVE